MHPFGCQLEIFLMEVGTYMALSKLKFQIVCYPLWVFGGPDDVCFNTWAEELSRILLKAIRRSRK